MVETCDGKINSQTAGTDTAAAITAATEPQRNAVAMTATKNVAKGRPPKDTGASAAPNSSRNSVAAMVSPRPTSTASRDPGRNRGRSIGNASNNGQHPQQAQQLAECRANKWVDG